MSKVCERTEGERVIKRSCLRRVTAAELSASEGRHTAPSSHSLSPPLTDTPLRLTTDWKHFVQLVQNESIIIKLVPFPGTI